MFGTIVDRRSRYVRLLSLPGGNCDDPFAQAAHARFADSTTGRGITAAVATIGRVAGVSESVVQRARRVRRDLGMGHEVVLGRQLQSREFMAAELHHGGHQRGAASGWALPSPRWVVEATPRPVAARRRSPIRSVHRAQAHRQRRQRRQAAAAKGEAANPQLSGVTLFLLVLKFLRSSFVRETSPSARKTHAGAITTSTNRPCTPNARPPSSAISPRTDGPSPGNKPESTQRRVEQMARATEAAKARSRAAGAEHRAAMRANWRTLATAARTTRPGWGPRMITADTKPSCVQGTGTKGAHGPPPLWMLFARSSGVDSGGGDYAGDIRALKQILERHLELLAGAV